MKFNFAAVLTLIAIMAVVTGCERGDTRNNGDSFESFPVSSDTSSVQTMADEKSADKPTSPTLGPVSTAHNFFVGPGGTLQGNTYVQSNFSTINAHLVADFVPSALTFELNSEGVNEVYPTADLTVYKPGDSEWTTLEQEVFVSGEVRRSYEFDKATSGKYAIRILYNETSPTQSMTPRPILKVESIELVR